MHLQWVRNYFFLNIFFILGINIFESWIKDMISPILRRGVKKLSGSQQYIKRRKVSNENEGDYDEAKKQKIAGISVICIFTIIRNKIICLVNF